MFFFSNDSMIPGSFKEAFYGLNIELHTLILNAGVMALPQRRPCGRRGLMADQ